MTLSTSPRISRLLYFLILRGLIPFVFGQTEEGVAELVSFAYDDSLFHIEVIINATTSVRVVSGPPNAHFLIADPLMVALNNYLAPPAPSPPPPPGQELFATPPLLSNKTSDLALLPGNQNLLVLSDSLHAWLANETNHDDILLAVVSNSSGVLDVEQFYSNNASAVCRQLTRYSTSVVLQTTRDYCCDSNGSLPDGHLALVCNARIYEDVSAFMVSANTSNITFGIPGNYTNVTSLVTGLNETTGKPATLAKRDSPCSPGDLSNILKGQLPSVSCCFTVAPFLNLCLKVDGDIAVVDYSGGNTISVHTGLNTENTYCSPQHINQTDNLLYNAPCTSIQMTPAIFQNLTEAEFIELVASLCFTGGTVVDFLVKNLGYNPLTVCAAQLSLKYYELMGTLSLRFTVTLDVPDVVDFDMVMEGDIQITRGNLWCSFLRDNYDLSVSEWCVVYHAPGCWWNPGDSNLDMTIILYAVGIVHKSWSWPIFSKADIPNPPCPPKTGSATTPIPPPPPPRITRIDIKFCCKDAGKDSNTDGTISFSLSDGTALANINIPDGNWNPNSDYTLSATLNYQLTAAQVPSTFLTHIDWVTVGRDDMDFSISTKVTFSDTFAATVYCLDGQHVGCGSHGSTTHHCAWPEHAGAPGAFIIPNVYIQNCLCTSP